MVSRRMPVASSLTLTFTPATTAPCGSVTVPVSVALAACWPMMDTCRQPASKTIAARERDSAGDIIYSFRGSGLIDAACNPVVDPGSYLASLTLAARLSNDANDGFGV